MDTLLDAFAAIDQILWGPWTMLFMASVAVYFTVRSGVFQLIKFPYIVRNTFGKIFEKPGDLGTQRITPFQAAATSLAGTVGMGNIAGVATALSVGGPLGYLLDVGPGFFRDDVEDRRDQPGRSLSRC